MLNLTRDITSTSLVRKNVLVCEGVFLERKCISQSEVGKKNLS